MKLPFLILFREHFRGVRKNDEEHCKLLLKYLKEYLKNKHDSQLEEGAPIVIVGDGKHEVMLYESMKKIVNGKNPIHLIYAPFGETSKELYKNAGCEFFVEKGLDEINSFVEKISEQHSEKPVLVCDVDNTLFLSMPMIGKVGADCIEAFRERLEKYLNKKIEKRKVPQGEEFKKAFKSYLDGVKNEYNKAVFCVFLQVYEDVVGISEKELKKGFDNAINEFVEKQPSSSVSKFLEEEQNRNYDEYRIREKEGSKYMKPAPGLEEFLKYVEENEIPIIGDSDLPTIESRKFLVDKTHYQYVSKKMEVGMKKIKVGILGATGMVGQRFVKLLEDHPWFELTELVASERSAGKKYKDAVNWVIEGKVPGKVGGMIVKSTETDGLDAELFFSALPGSVAQEVEEKFLKAGYAISSNASAFRMDENVPLMIPEVNPEHLELIKNQKWEKFIVTNPNCSVIGLVIALKALQDKFGLKKVIVTTLQAISGAGYPGVAALDIVGNVVPYINGEEDKVESEPLKILGELQEGKVKNADIQVSASCNRVGVKDGHLECVSVELEKDATLEDVKNIFCSFKGIPQELGLPSVPEQPIIYTEDPSRPQPTKDLHPMSVIIGRLREDKVISQKNGFKFVLLSHTTIRGAAGGAILNAELLKSQGYLG